MPEPIVMAREMELARPESKSTPGVRGGSLGGFTLYKDEGILAALTIDVHC